MDGYSFDLTRIFIGDLPVLFIVEIIIRTTILYFYSLFILRTLGKRSAGDLTMVDVVVIVALGSAVGDPMFYPSVPLLHGMVVITLIVGLQRLGSYWGNRNEKLDQFLKGRPYRVIVDGTLDLEELNQASLTKREIFQMARQHGYRNLGEIRRMYIETDDRPSIFAFEADQIRPGLQFEPPWELESRSPLKTESLLKEPSIFVCTNCGQTSRFDAGDNLPVCPRCHQTTWSYAKQVVAG